MRRIPILTYHNIGEPSPGDRLPLLYVSPRRFAQQMRLLSLLGFRGLSLSAALPYLKGERRGRIVVLTFDDGYVDIVEQALPVLTAHGFTATCYLVSRCLDQYNLWDAERLGVRKPVMDRAQVREWLAAGMEVGGHTRTHPYLTRCSTETMWEEVAGCKQDLEREFGVEVLHFCYPYGDWDPRVEDTARQAGFRTAVTTRRAHATREDDLWQLPRVSIKYGYGLAHFLYRFLRA